MKTKRLRVKSRLKAGLIGMNHNQGAWKLKTKIRAGLRHRGNRPGDPGGSMKMKTTRLKVKSRLKAGQLGMNHNAVARGRRKQ